MNDNLRFLASGMRVEQDPVEADSPVEFERLRRRVEGLSCLHDEYAVSQRRIVRDRVNASVLIARYEAQARFRVRHSPFRLEVVA